MRTEQNGKKGRGGSLGRNWLTVYKRVFNTYGLQLEDIENRCKWLEEDQK